MIKEVRSGLKQSDFEITVGASIACVLLNFGFLKISAGFFTSKCACVCVCVYMHARRALARAPPARATQE